MRDACAKKASRTRRARQAAGERERRLFARYAKRPSFDRRRGNLIVGGDCWAHPWAQPLRAARSRASLRLSKFVPDEFVARGSRMLERTAAKPLARRARRRKRRVTGGFAHTSLSARYAKRPSFDRRCRNLIVGGDCWAHPWAQPFRAARSRASLRLSNFVPDKIVEPKRFRPHLSPPDTQNAPFGAFCVSGGERGIRTLDKAFDPILP